VFPLHENMPGGKGPKPGAFNPPCGSVKTIEGLNNHRDRRPPGAPPKWRFNSRQTIGRQRQSREQPAHSHRRHRRRPRQHPTSVSSAPIKPVTTSSSPRQSRRENDGHMPWKRRVPRIHQGQLLPRHPEQHRPKQSGKGGGFPSNLRLGFHSIYNSFLRLFAGRPNPLDPPRH